MCQSTNCCVACCVPTRGKGLWVTLAALLAASFALVCGWAYVAVRVDAVMLLRAAHLSLTDMPTVVTSWWSPTARHLLAREAASGRLVLPAGPGVIQATMALLVLIPAGVVVWVRCGAPVPIWARQRAQIVTGRLPALPGTLRRVEGSVGAREGSARVPAALPYPTRPGTPALPAPPSTALPSASPRFIRLADADYATTGRTARTGRPSR